MKRTARILGCAVAVMLASTSVAALGQAGLHSHRLVTKAVNEKQLVTRFGNVHPAVNRGQDRGKLDGGRSLDHLRLQLQRSAEDEAALNTFIDDLHNPKSASFHKWLTPTQFMEQFGPDPADVSRITDWLQSKNLTVNFVTPSMTIDFSGSVKAVSEAFHTEIHNIDVDGVRHFANVSNPSIPEALSTAVLGPVALHDFKPHRLGSRVVPPVKQYTVNSNYQLVVPGDLATIYNYNPVYSSGISGQGQTIALLERTDLYSNGDWSMFRKVFGLSKSFPKGNLVVVHPKKSGGKTTVNGIDVGPEKCTDPGVLVGDDGEAALDVEWASASAPSATIELASCADTETNFGAFIALENLLGSDAPPSVMSLSYGSPESENGTDGNAYISALYQLAITEGVSLFVSTGDADADVTDQNRTSATHGINVNALASTPYNVAVGGTDFYANSSKYWSPTNSATYSSARSYVPEIPWNDSCASQVIAAAYGFGTTYGAGGFCNDPNYGAKYFLSTAGGSGGPSGCARGETDVPGVVSGTCKGYKKPSFQTGVFGVPSDKVRDLPDVSMFAANGVFGHYFVYCYSNVAGDGVPCTGAPSGWAGAGGTSFAAPIWAGIQALINQGTGSPQGNPNYIYYALADAEYGAGGNAACNASLGSTVAANCVFHDITVGDIDANCTKLRNTPYNCYYPPTNPGANGVLSTSNDSYEPAFAATRGYDLATGLGTPNVVNLILGFANAESTH